MASTVCSVQPVVGDPDSVEIISFQTGQAKIPTRATSPMIDAVAGGISGMIGIFAGSPFDVVKARMQSSHTPISAISVVQKTLAKEGVTAFWKGVTPPLLAEGGLNHIWFFIYAYTCAKMHPDPHIKLPFYQAFIAGGFAGLVGSFIVAPVDLIKIRSQLNEGTGHNRKTPMDVVREICKNEGYRGFTRGITAAILRDVPGLGMFFGAYNFVKNVFRRNDGTISGLGQFVAGGTAGVCSWVVSYPFDVIKTRMQLNLEYKSVLHCARDSFRNEGFQVFFRGITPCLVGSIPINATIFFIYELLVQASWELNK